MIELGSHYIRYLVNVEPYNIEENRKIYITSDTFLCFRYSEVRNFINDNLKTVYIELDKPRSIEFFLKSFDKVNEKIIISSSCKHYSQPTIVVEFETKDKELEFKLRFI